MSRVNAQSLISLDNVPELGNVSPQAPNYLESSIRGGQFRAGAPSQRVGPSDQEALFAALADVAGGVQKGIDAFSSIRQQVEKKEIEKARLKFKEIYAKESIDGTETPINPESKLEEWNLYVKDVWTPLLGDEWKRELNLDAYTSLGSAEAQNKFEQDRYEREFVEFFNKPENVTKYNPSSPTAKVLFDSYYSDKYPTASSNFWFKAKALDNRAGLNNERSSIAISNLPVLIDNILPIPSVDALKGYRSTNPRSTDEQLELNNQLFFQEVYPNVSGLNREDAYKFLFNFYKAKIIDENPNKYTGIELVELEKALTKELAPKINQIIESRDLLLVKEEETIVTQGLIVHTQALANTDRINETIPNYMNASLSYLLSRGSPSEKANSVASMLGDIWSTYSLAMDKKSGFTVQRSVGEDSSVSLAVETAFPILREKASSTGIYKGQNPITLSSLSPFEQHELVSALTLERILNDPVLLAKHMEILGVKDRKEFINRYKSSFSYARDTSKDLNERQNNYVTGVLGLNKEFSDLVNLDNNPDSIAIRTNERIGRLSKLLKVPENVLRSIYIKKDKEKETYDVSFDIPKWLNAQDPKIRAIVESSGYSVDEIKKIAETAYNAEIIALSKKQKLDEAAVKAAESAGKDYTTAVDLANKKRTDADGFGLGRSLVSRNTEGNLVVGLTTGTVHGKKDNKYVEDFKIYGPASIIVARIPLDGENKPTRELTETEILALQTLAQFEQGSGFSLPAEQEYIKQLRAQTSELIYTTAEAALRVKPVIDGLNSSLPVKVKDEDLSRWNEEFKLRLIRGEVSAFDGTYSADKFISSDGSLTQEGYEFLLLADLTFNTSFNLEDNRHENPTRKVVENIVKNLTENITLDPDPDEIRDPKNIIPYVTFTLMGKAYGKAIDEGRIQPISDAGWFVDRLAILANVSEGIDIEKQVEYYTSKGFRDAATYAYALPLVFSAWARNTPNSDVNLFSTSTPDQMNIAKDATFSPALYAQAGITQSQGINIEAFDPLKDSTEADRLTLLQTMVGPAISPSNPKWSADVAHKAWIKAGIIPKDMSLAVFAARLRTSVLSGATLPNQDDSTTIRLAFQAFDALNAQNPRFMSNMVRMSLDRTYGVGSAFYPETVGKPKEGEVLNFIMAASGVIAADNASAFNQSGAVLINNNATNQTLVQNSPTTLVRMVSISKPSYEQSYSISALGKVIDAVSNDPYNPISYMQEYSTKFRPASEQVEGTVVEYNGIPYIAGTTLLESKPTEERLRLMTRPIVGSTLANISYSLLLKQAAEKETTFDAIVFLDSELEKAGVGIPLINKEELYDANKQIRAGASAIYQNEQFGNNNDSAAFTYSWINRDLNGNPVIHLPNGLFTKSFEFPRNPRLVQKQKEEEIKKEQLESARNRYAAGVI
jgi:hypothetical protein